MRVVSPYHQVPIRSLVVDLHRVAHRTTRPSSAGQFCTMTIGKSSLFSTIRNRPSRCDVLALVPHQVERVGTVEEFHRHAETERRGTRHAWRPDFCPGGRTARGRWPTRSGQSAFRGDGDGRSGSGIRGHVDLVVTGLIADKRHPLSIGREPAGALSPGPAKEPPRLAVGASESRSRRRGDRSRPGRPSSAFHDVATT